MRHIGLFVLCALFAALTLTGCPPGAPDGGGREILFWTFAQNNLDEWVARKAEIEKKINVKFTMELVPQNGFIQKLQAVMTEGKDVPDVIEWMIENNRILNADAKKCFVHPLEKYTAASDLYKKVPKGRTAWVTYGPHVYGLPHDVHPVVLIYNDSLWKAAGVDVASLKDWDEFMQAGVKLIAKKEGGKPVSYALPSGDGGLGDSMWMIWQQTGAQVLDKDGKPILTNDKFKAFVTKWLEWKKLGVFTNWDWGNFGALLKNGTLCSYTTPDWWVGQVNAAAEDGKYQFRVRDLPLYAGGNGSHTSSWGGSFLAVPKTVKDLDFMWKLVEYMQYGNPEVAVMRYETGGMLAPLPDAWGDPVFSKPDARFGGQVLGELQVAMAKQAPEVNAGDVFWDAVGYFNEQYTEIASGKISVDEGLKAAQDKALQRLQ